ncbi:MAG: phage minor head protein, partial [Candidatus Hydrogenedentes bacterium]|nr:phage minor head protein [Candidatus Hydrogenedentota bacterium]
MASPRTIDLILTALVDRIQSQYIGFIRAVLLGEAFDAAPLVQMTAKALLLADLEGRAYAVTRARAAGIEYEFDDLAAIDFIPDLPDALHYAKPDAPIPDIPGTPRAAVAVGVPKIGKMITSMPLKRMARAFRRSVPNITQRILTQAARMGGTARQVWAQESVAVLETLAPMLQNQLKEGVSLQQFFLDAEAKTQRAEFGQIARGRLENIFRTNLSTAAGEAAFEQSHDERIMHAVVFYKYFAVGDNRVRPQHWAFNGFIAPKDWPGWVTIKIPNGFSCRCAPAGTLFTGDARRMGLIDEQNRPIESKYKKTWGRAIAAGLLTPTGALTYP